MSYEQRSFAGGAADTTLQAGISPSSLTFTVAPGTGTGFPDGSGGSFYMIIDYDNSKAEKILCTARSGDTFSYPDVGHRGVDGTSAASHDSPAKVRHCFTAVDAQEANRAAANTVGKITTKGDLLVGAGANTLARQAVGTDGQYLRANSAAPNGIDYAPVTKTIRVPHTWAITGSIAVPSGDTDYIPPFFIPVPSGQTANLVAARYRINSGTSATVKLQQNGVDIGGYTGLSVTTTPTSTTSSVALADNDLLALIVTAVAGTPKNLSFTVYLDLTV